MDNTYTIIQKQFNGLKIESVVIENDEGKKKLISIDDAVKLARKGAIKNAKALLDTDSGEYILAIENGLTSIENLDKSKNLLLSLKARLIVDSKCVGYKAEDTKGKTYTLSIEKVWQLAEQGSIKGIQAKIINNKKALVSTNELQLKDLPRI